MVPISDKDIVIRKYEIGLSQFLIGNGYTLTPALYLSPETRLRALCHAVRLGHYRPDLSHENEARLNLHLVDQLNPTHYAWEELINQLGVVKRELFEKNPLRLDLHELYEVFGEKLDAL